MAHEALDDILTPAAELPAVLGRPNLQLLFTVDGWHQPDFTSGELPSTIPCFQAVADSILPAPRTA
jgi:hypothetical protein